jgi:hypothetical protein
MKNYYSYIQLDSIYIANLHMFVRLAHKDQKAINENASKPKLYS